MMSGTVTQFLPTVSHPFLLAKTIPVTTTPSTTANTSSILSVRANHDGVARDSVR